MADNTNAQAVLISNAKIRPACDRILQTYFFMKAMQAEYTAQNWAALFPSGDPTGELIDGARQDGRTVITNVDVNNVITALGAFITHLEATTNQNRDRYLKPSVNAERTV